MRRRGVWEHIDVVSMLGFASVNDGEDSLIARDSATIEAAELWTAVS